MDKQFQQASQLKLRFPTAAGHLSVEDLFDLPLTSATGRVNLNDIAKDLQREVKAQTEVTSFVDTMPSGPDEVLELKFSLVKDVIAVRVAERDAAANAQKKRDEKQKLLALIAKKSDEALEGRSLEELTAMVNAL